MDSPFWDDWMPPNGWGCKCWVRQITKVEAERRGISMTPDSPDVIWDNKRTGQRKLVPKGIDPGWARNPGKLRMEAVETILADKIAALPPDVARAALRDIATSWQVRRILQGTSPAIAPIGVLPADLVATLNAKTKLISVSGATADKQLVAHPELVASDYDRLADLFESGIAVQQTEHHIGFLSRDAELPWVAVVKATRDRNEIYLVSFYQAASRRYVQRFMSRGPVLRQ